MNYDQTSVINLVASVLKTNKMAIYNYIIGKI